MSQVLRRFSFVLALFAAAPAAQAAVNLTNLGVSNPRIDLGGGEA